MMPCERKSVEPMAAITAPPSPPAEQTTAREDQAWQASTGDGAGNVAHTRDSVVETESFEAAHRFTKSD